MSHHALLLRATYDDSTGSKASARYCRGRLECLVMIGNGNKNRNAEWLPRGESESAFFAHYWVSNVDPSWFVRDKCEKKLSNSLDPQK